MAACSAAVVAVKSLSPQARDAINGLWQAWNAGGDMGQSWKTLLDVWPEVSLHAEQWCLEQALQADLAAALVQFYLNWI